MNICVYIIGWGDTGGQSSFSKSSHKTTSRYNPLEDTPSPLVWVFHVKEIPLENSALATYTGHLLRLVMVNTPLTPLRQLGPSSQGGVSLNVDNIYILIKILFGLSRVSVNLLVPAPAAPFMAKSFQRMGSLLRLCSCFLLNESSESL